MSGAWNTWEVAAPRDTPPAWPGLGSPGPWEASTRHGPSRGALGCSAFIFSLKHVNEGVTRSVCVFDGFCFVLFLIYYLIS